MTDDAASTPTRTEVDADDHTMQEAFIGTDRDHRGTNASWGAVLAGTVMFLALMVVFGLISGALGLSGAGGIVVAIWSIIAMVLALAAAGFVAGALAMRGGLLHGLVTWATSLVGILVLVGVLGAGVLGAVGGALGGVAQGADVSLEEMEQATEDVDVDEQEVDEAQQEAGDAAQEAQGAAAASAWGAVAGLILGAAVAGFAGVAGARSTLTRRTHTVETGARHRRNR